ncbi:MAG TPA: hypothetical protein VMF65_25485 [Acidimicrobiales bacterium]|nr:hypothetical protein [Acidimicrobiales bacterium]
MRTSTTTRRVGPHRAGRRAAVAGTGLATLIFGLGGASSAGAQAGGAGAAGPAFSTPLATSVQAGGGTWATVAMGNLKQPLNTFWQLMFRPDGSSTWSDRVEATAVATNGGLVMAAGANALVVGVRPSNDLTFSPLISTTNAGRSWSNGLLDQGLASRPRALALGPGGRALAVVEGRGGAEVVRGTGNLSSWQPLATTRALASAPAGRACSPSAITSVGFLSSTAVIGSSCQRPGEAGIFMENGHSWKLSGPNLASRAGRAEVLGLMPAQGGLATLLGLTAAARGVTGAPATGPSLVAAWAGSNGKWRTSAPLGLGNNGRLVSFGAASAAGDGIFALTASPDGRMELAVTSGPRPVWEHFPAPPQTTATVAFLPGGTIDALAVHNVVLTVWALSSGSSAWVKRQVLDVPVQFGSSS